MAASRITPTIHQLSAPSGLARARVHRRQLGPRRPPGEARSPGASRLVTVCLGAAALLMATAAVARAGLYVIANCPSAGNGNAGGWMVFGSPQTDKASCGGGAGDWIGPQGGSMGPNTWAGVQIGAPDGSGITIQQARVWWKVPSSISGATI